jgi:hypothetical protein
VPCTWPKRPPPELPGLWGSVPTLTSRFGLGRAYIGGAWIYLNKKAGEQSSAAHPYKSGISMMEATPKLPLDSRCQPCSIWVQLMGQYDRESALSRSAGPRGLSAENESGERSTTICARLGRVS